MTMDNRHLIEHNSHEHPIDQGGRDKGARGRSSVLSFLRHMQQITEKNDLWQSGAQLIHDAIAADGGGIMLLDPISGDLLGVAASVEGADSVSGFKNIRVSGKIEPITRLLQRDQTMQDALVIQSAMETIHPLFMGNECMLVSPVWLNATVAGILWAFKKKGAFNRDEADLLPCLSGAIGSVMETIYGRDTLATYQNRMSDFNFAKDRVIHTLSHSYKTPLAVLIASLELLKKHLQMLPDSAWQTVYTRAKRNLDRLLDLEYDMEDILRQRDSSVGNPASDGSGLQDMSK
jgi:signal transduction histidine kinase